MDVSTIPSVAGARSKRKRLGRGIGSGRGKTSGRGQKGQRARSGSGKHPGFEGGQNPLIRRMPKRGFRRKSSLRRSDVQIINVGQLDGWEAGLRIAPQELMDAGLIRKASERVKLLGDGSLAKRLTIAVHEVSAKARAKVEKAGGSIEVLKDKPGVKQAPSTGS